MILAFKLFIMILIFKLFPKVLVFKMIIQLNINNFISDPI